MKEEKTKIEWRATVKKEIEDAYGSGWRSWMAKGGFMEQLAKKLNARLHVLKPQNSHSGTPDWVGTWRPRSRLF